MTTPASPRTAPIKPLLATALGALLLAASLAPAHARDRDSRRHGDREPPVVIFSDAGFKGRGQALDLGSYDTDDIALGNDSVSSVHVAPGYRVILFKNSHFEGKAKELTEDASGLGNFNDDTSSIRVERASSGRYDERAAVVLYADSNYRGRSQPLSPGRYDLDDLEIGNDRLSSLRVARGCRVVLFSDEHFSGRAEVVTSDVPFLSRSNDSASSVQVDCR